MAVEPLNLATTEERPNRWPGRRLYGAVLHKLGMAIVSGEFAPGSTLNGEVAFSQELQVSRGAYREAMQVLASKGLVESRTKTGTRVLPRERWNVLDPEVLSWAFAGRPDREFVKDIFELRATIEPAAAGLAAQRRTRGDLNALAEALEGMKRHSLGSPAGQSADRDFHKALLLATHNAAISVLSASICAAVGWTTHFKHRSASLPRNAIPDHVKVYDAIAAGDANLASQTMRGLVTMALEDTRAVLAADHL